MLKHPYSIIHTPSGLRGPRRWQNLPALLLIFAFLRLTPQAKAETVDCWTRYDRVLSSVAANYYTKPDPVAMLRSALIDMCARSPHLRFDPTSHRDRFRIRQGRRIVASFEHPDDIDDLVAALVKATAILHMRSNIAESEFIDAGLRGAVAGLGDCYTVYLTPSMVDRLSFTPDQQKGEVGLAVDCGRGGRVRHVRAGSPAYMAGIEPGDRLLAVGGQSCRGLDAVEIYALLSGVDQSQVRVQLLRRSGVELSVDLRREVRAMEQASVHDLAKGAVLYLRPGSFDADTTQRVQDQLRCAQRRAAILDLRGNGGGRVDEAERLAGLFLGPGIISSIEGRAHRQMGVLKTTRRGPCSSLALVVLIDSETASAAELTAQALRERRQAPLIGQATYGKGSVQHFIHFPDGAIAKVTTARYLSPLGRPLDRSLEPDLKVSDPGLTLGADSDPLIDPVVRLALRRLTAQAHVPLTPASK